MIEGLGEEYLRGALEAMLFVTDEPVNVLSLSQMLEADAKDIEDALHELQKSYEDSDSGIQLREIAGGWRLFTHPRYHELIERYVLSWDTRKLSAAALETLAIVAYTQPVTRAQISSIRGVSSDSSINSLIEKGLVREAGTADAPGNPTLYATTKAFLEKFGLNSVKDLTDISEFAPDDETRRLISERLSTTRDEILITDEQAAMLAEGMIDGETIDIPTVQASSKDTAAHKDESPKNGDERDANTTNSEDAEMSAMFRDAIASTLGIVDKIDFDELNFDLSDE